MCVGEARRQRINLARLSQSSIFLHYHRKLFMESVHVRIALGAAIVATGLTALFLSNLRGSRRKRPAVGKFIIFLDIDGVINRTEKNKQVIIEPDLVLKLKQIIERGGSSAPAQIVLSTFWKPFDCYISYVLSRQGIDGRLVVGATPGVSKSTTVQHSTSAHLLHPEAFDCVDRFPKRADEIRAFLARHPQIERFVILDDRKDAADGDLLAHFVRTNPNEGLTDEAVSRALEMLT